MPNRLQTHCRWERPGGPEWVQVYACTDCTAAKRKHEIVEVPAGPAKNWGGAPSHWRECTGCLKRDGPWVKESDVHAGL